MKRVEKQRQEAAQSHMDFEEPDAVCEPPPADLPLESSAPLLPRVLALCEVLSQIEVDPEDTEPVDLETPETPEGPDAEPEPVDPEPPETPVALDPERFPSPLVTRKTSQVRTGDPDTSEQAATVNRGSHRFAMLGAFYRHYLKGKRLKKPRARQGGMVYGEAAIEANIAIVSSPDKRITELKDEYGYLEPTGVKRRMTGSRGICTEYRLSEKGLTFAVNNHEALCKAFATSTPAQVRAELLDRFLKEALPHLPDHLPHHGAGCACLPCSTIRDLRIDRGLTAKGI